MNAAAVSQTAIEVGADCPARTGEEARRAVNGSSSGRRFKAGLHIEGHGVPAPPASRGSGPLASTIGVFANSVRLFVTVGVMALAKRQWLGSLMFERVLLVLGVGVLMGLAGPFGSYPPLSTPVRYGVWIGFVSAGFIAATAAHRLVRETRLTLPHPWVRPVIVALASAAPMTFLVAWVISLVRPGHTVAPLAIPSLFVAVSAMQLLIVVLLLRDRRERSEPVAVAVDDRRAGFPEPMLARLPNRLGRKIVALQAEDHYLRLHTELGSDLILMRLSDAVGQIDRNLGLQVHRSWWVANGAIAEVEKDGQRTLLRLHNGLRVPVGRTYLAAARTAIAAG
jgi:hypothetical protein